MRTANPPRRSRSSAGAGGPGSQFVEEGTGAPFKLAGRTKTTGEQYMTGALLVKGPGDAEPVRFSAKLTDDKKYPPDLEFKEDKGSRSIKAGQNKGAENKADPLNAMLVPSTATVAVALLLNFMLIAVWVVAFWPILRFSFGHALMFTAVLAIITMVALMPILFKQNRTPKPPAAAPTASCGSPKLTRRRATRPPAHPARGRRVPPAPARTRRPRPRCSGSTPRRLRAAPPAARPPSRARNRRPDHRGDPRAASGSVSLRYGSSHDRPPSRRTTRPANRSYAHRHDTGLPGMRKRKSGGEGVKG